MSGGGQGDGAPSGRGHPEEGGGSSGSRPREEGRGGEAAGGHGPGQELREMAEDRQDLAEDRTEWANVRTLLAKERTFSAWLRTGLATLVGGIAALRLLGHQGAGGTAGAGGPGGAAGGAAEAISRSPWATALGVILVAVSAVIFAMGYWSYRKTLQELEDEGIRGIPTWILLAVTGALVVGCGLGLILVL